MEHTSESVLLKGAHYAEEPAQGTQHAQSFLFPIDRVNGFVYGVVHAFGEREEFEALVGIVQNHLERLSETVDRGTNLTHRFEQLLQALNEEIATAVETKEVRLPIADVSSIIGMADTKAIVVSGFGSLFAQFMHRGTKERYEIYDLTKGMRVEDEVPSWKKPYLTVLDGELRPGDVLFIGTKITRQEMTIATLNDVLTTLPPNGAVGKIRQYLPPETVFAAVVIKSDRVDEPDLVSDETAHASLESLDRTGSKTDKYLSEQKPDLRSLLFKTWRTLFPKDSKDDRRKRAKRFFKFLLRLILVVLTVIGQILMAAVMTVVRAVQKTVKDPKQTAERFKGAGRKVDGAIRGGIQRFNQLSRTRKQILLAVSTVAVIFFVSIIFINREQASQASLAAYNQSVNAVQKKIDNADASLIYGDEATARTLLGDATNLIGQLPAKTDAQKKKISDLQSEVTSKLDQLRHATAVSPTTVADGSSLSGVTFSAIAPFGGKTYAITKTGDVYVLNGSSFANVPVTKGNVGEPKAVTESDNAIYWIDSGLSRFIPSTSKVDPLNINRQAVSLTYYGGKLYVLSPTTGQIYKHLPTASGFDGGTAWVTQGVSSLTNGVSITIDGYIWVLTSDGNILRFLSGKLTDWKLGAVDPSLAGATEIWTSDSSNNLYVLDPNGKRVVVFDKAKGGVVVQYTSDAFSGANGMIVDEANKKIRVLVGNKLLEFATK